MTQAPDAPSSSAPGPLKLEDFLCFSVYAAGHAFNRLYRPLLDKLGLTYPQYLAMVVLWEADDRTVGELGGRLGLESSTLTPLLKRLEGLGLVSRTRDPADERVVRIRLTDKGRALKGPACAVPAELLATSGLDVAAVARIRDELAGLNAALTRAEQTGR
ncbi:MAG: MarR family transcriptional regulator [Alphaproteobacteria bacterium]|nr:MarR family transcriptional regulator [Alphaproteobacteria bacterium]MBU1513305.1 MarR family transcriptional regulator [Alphaproteobacteria bacterium]MBU2095924.1 MarR family transcriptional regulator [Alphaproteobacteria bacterium]MBU2152150.1 MarR family transcriptional regulator [Alphaproteobacteria bacterium]MBU2306194.1 MarR family transcriptional regulator [Alphaproteobacteria bacterium]